MALPVRSPLSAVPTACAFLLLSACSSSETPSTAGGDASGSALEIATVSGKPLAASAGDALALTVVQKMPDRSTAPLPSGAKVVWKGPATVTALDPSSTAASPIPNPGSKPTAFFIDNPGRLDHDNDLAGVLFVTDPGKTKDGEVTVTATVSGVASGGSVTASISVGPVPMGDATRGATAYGADGANCARCHGATGHGTVGKADGSTDASPEYLIAGKDYAYPAPGLNTEPGNAGGDPAWNAALFAMSARADMDNGGLTLREPMPDWLVTHDANGNPPTTQDLVDIYAFMKTQTH